MQSKTWALYAKSRLPWVLTAALTLGAPASGLAATSDAHPERQAALAAWGDYHPKGWSAGSVARGTGYWRPGASLRVREVQRRLNQLDYGAGRVDGLFGPLTDAAVRRYQRDRALQLDGIVGPQTLEDLRARTRRVRASADRQAPLQDTAGRSAPRTEAARDGANRPLWELALLFAALIAILLVAAVLVVHIRGLTRRAAALIRARLKPAETRSMGGHYRTAYVEGRSADQKIGAFRGFAYTIRPMVGSDEEAEEAASLLVYDPSKPRPVSARLSEITAINGQAVRPSRRHAQPAVEPDRLVQPAAESDHSAASVTPLSSRRRKSRAALRIVRRIEAPRPAKAGGGAPPTSGARMSERHRGRFPNRFRWIGARVHLADAEGVDPMPGILTLPVELELFAESESRRWETGLLETDEPLHISVGDLEAGVRAAVVPRWIPELAEALAEGGVVIDIDELERLPFAVERSIEVERAIAGMEVSSMPAS
jgi:peptidoglycan hydrolase-like protein with peptidoglycan-binding domain